MILPSLGPIDKVSTGYCLWRFFDGRVWISTPCGEVHRRHPSWQFRIGL